MRNFVLGVIFGIIVSTIGFAGLAAVFDKGVVYIKENAKELSK